MSKLKQFVISNKLTRKLVAPIHRSREKARKKKQESIFVEKSGAILKVTQECLNSLGYESFVCFGTLLGLVRDNKIIGRDLDIDVAVLVNGQDNIEKAHNHFLSLGFKVHHTYHVEGIGVIQNAYYKDEVNVDVSYFFVSKKQSTTYLLYDDDKVLSFSIPKVTGYRTLVYREAELKVPNNSEDVLVHLYGTDWRKPDPHYIYWKCKVATLHPDMVGKTDSYNA